MKSAKTRPIQRYLAFDFGAESGRAVVGWVQDGRLVMEELHRFPNGPVHANGSMFWDVLRLFEETKQALKMYREKYGASLAGIGFDTWGVDYVLLDRNGNLLGNPHHYRDRRTAGMMKKVFGRVSRARVFECTGIQFMDINTLYQMYAARNTAAMRAADTFLMMADYFAYLYTGRKVQEFTLATTSQLYDPRKDEWSRELFDRLGLRRDIMPPIVRPGAVIGALRPEIAEATGITDARVIAVATHDTASAIAAVPGLKPGHAYLSSGTWMLMGIEVREPLINRDVLTENFTNEGGVGGTFRFLKNIMGLWLIQGCRRVWNVDYTEITARAKTALPFAVFIDPDDPRFLNPADMPGEIAEFCRITGQAVPRDQAETARCIFESLALKCRYVLERIEKLSGRRVEVLHILGGGCRNAFLCQCIADACGVRVQAGPVEATATGNILVQMLGAGDLRSIRDGRELVERSVEMVWYEPGQRHDWEEAYRRFLPLVRNHHG
jgi:rhamnulokinase